VQYKELVMPAKRVFLWALVLMLLAPACVPAQETGTITYKIDAKPYHFGNGRLEYYKSEGYISLTCEKTGLILDPSGSGQKLEVDEGMTIQLVGEQSEFAGSHQATSADAMPAYFSWYEIVPSADKKGKELKNYLASLDSGDEKKMVIHLKIDAFGPPGSIIQGTFSGTLFDEAGGMHQITEGRFAVPRKDME
jgi:hypothetical protein